MNPNWNQNTVSASFGSLAIGRAPCEAKGALSLAIGQNITTEDRQIVISLPDTKINVTMTLKDAGFLFRIQSAFTNDVIADNIKVEGVAALNNGKISLDESADPANTNVGFLIRIGQNLFYYTENKLYLILNNGITAEIELEGNEWAMIDGAVDRHLINT